MKSKLVLTPVFGVLLFASMYFVATLFYPGGSQNDKNSVGFSWRNNYWCNLLNLEAINGEVNAARPYAMIAMIVLCVSLSSFWLLFSMHTNIGNGLKRLILVTGILSMICSVFLLSAFDHDLVVNSASLLGLIAVIATIVALYKLKWKMLFMIGLLNIMLVGVNNIFYYGSDLIVYLPVIQKITFAVFLIWICMINTRMYRQQRIQLNKESE